MMALVYTYILSWPESLSLLMGYIEVKLLACGQYVNAVNINYNNYLTAAMLC